MASSARKKKKKKSVTAEGGRDAKGCGANQPHEIFG